MAAAVLPRPVVHGASRQPLLDPWFLPETPGPGVLAAHVLLTGNGAYWADRPHSPRTVLVQCGPHRVVRGDPRFIAAEQLAPLGRGQFSAPDRFLPLLGRTFASVMPWVRVICTQQHPPRLPDLPPGVRLRPLTTADAAAQLAELDPGLRWITETWGPDRAPAAAAGAWGAFAHGRLVSVAATYLRGRCYEDVAVVTVPEFRRAGLGLACVGTVTGAVRRRGRIPTWTVPGSNGPSRALAEAAGFVPVRRETVYWVGPARVAPPR
ncbi:GNAT family N-acetyltransferase [Saccharothrix sp. ST-888]|uniref:GNAT family N-acetyltransferase n=1 Tax=Saccharothrix sp. ST-888 TaxID=1427391 RepID=UPI000696B904|nr:GNAT family N-acetyltransferase [Saccharothrix sp. ST-888]